MFTVEKSWRIFEQCLSLMRPLSPMPYIDQFIHWKNESGMKNGIQDDGTEDHHLLPYRFFESSNTITLQLFNYIGDLERNHQNPSLQFLGLIGNCNTTQLPWINNPSLQHLWDQSVIEKLSFRFRLVGEASMLPKRDFTKHVCGKLSKSVLSLTFYCHFLITLWLFSKAVIVYSVARM